jgi:type I restriction enzyme, R subunit
MASEKDKHLRLDEKNHVEEPFLKQLEAMPDLGWKVLRLDMGNGQMPNQTGRTDFTQVIMFNELKESLKRINP